tara:strand:- start:490 stop:1644 length:1155 start_codon:yes stop_codon:yes gene_type:complete
LKVAHIKSPFLPLPETFIYSYINESQKYEPIIVSEHHINNDQFPVKNIIAHKNNKELNFFLKKVRYWLAGKIQRELLFKNFYANSLKKINPNIVHIHFGVPGLMLSRLIKKLNLPFIVSFYGYDLSQIPNTLGNDIYKKNKLFENGSVFTAEGNHAKRKLIELGCPIEKAYLLRIGIDVKKYKYLPRVRAKKEPIKILFCGRFVPKKGLLLAINAISKSLEAGNNIIFNIIGDGPQKDEAISLINNLGISKKVNFLGFLNHQQFISECYNNHLFIAPSQTDIINGETEGGAPTVLIEAQATGMPIVASDHADIPDVVLKNQSGFLAKESDEEKLSEALEELIKNENNWSKMGGLGRDHIINQHDISSIIIQLENLYSNSINEFN